MAVLLLFRRYLYTLQLGVCLLAVNLVYTVNIYGLWFPSRHTQALFGFVFYLWLGSYIANNFEAANQLLNKISFSASVVLAFFTYLLSIGESYWLTLLNNPDPLNSLRFTNQLFSLAVALVLFKLTRPTWPRFVDVRRHTFGLYLSHTIVMTILLRPLKMIHDHLGARVPVSNVGYIIAVSVLIATTYFASLMITEAIARISPLRWMVGLGPQKYAPRTVTKHFDPQLHSKIR
jgi:membrane-bound acyltransferase YfiQ involved in biofilm formation